jgi:hypothetical protein
MLVVGCDTDKGARAERELRDSTGNPAVEFVPAERVSPPAEVNGQPGIISDVDRRPISVLVRDLVDGRIQTISIVTNPEKLAGLPPLSLADPN